MTKSIDSIKDAEQGLEEATAALRREFHAVRTTVQRSTISPYAIGGIVVGTLALGYFATRRFGKARRDASPTAARRLERGLEVARVVMPLLGAWMAVKRARAESAVLPIA